MPSFNIIKKLDFDSTFRTESIMGNFDLNKENLFEEFIGNIDIENKDWNVGLIVGGSGTGKSTIAKEIFGDNYFNDYQYNSKSVIDDMPKRSINEITFAFTSVGFSSPPSWLKPYRVLSNGEKMRVDLARNILDQKDLIIFDEFTSVVNREVAKTSSFAISKAIRKTNRKFIAIACHFDIIDWLEPDWIYNTDKKEFFFIQKLKNDQQLNYKYQELIKMNKNKYGEFLRNIII